MDSFFASVEVIERSELKRLSVVEDLILKEDLAGEL
jgi:hypothetical protein